MAKRKQITEYRDLSLEELEQCAQEMRRTLFRLRSEAGIPGNIKPSDLNVARRNLARILTVTTEKQQQQEA